MFGKKGTVATSPAKPKQRIFQRVGSGLKHILGGVGGLALGVVKTGGIAFGCERLVEWGYEAYTGNKVDWHKDKNGIGVEIIQKDNGIALNGSKRRQEQNANLVELNDNLVNPSDNLNETGYSDTDEGIQY